MLAFFADVDGDFRPTFEISDSDVDFEHVEPAHRAYTYEARINNDTRTTPCKAGMYIYDAG